jgi:hypothetical protein
MDFVPYCGDCRSVEIQEHEDIENSEYVNEAHRANIAGLRHLNIESSAFFAGFAVFSHSRQSMFSFRGTRA